MRRSLRGSMAKRAIAWLSCQADVLPGLTPVVGTVDSVAAEGDRTTARLRFAGAGEEHTVTGHGDRAHALRPVVRPHGLVRHARIAGLPDTTRGGGDEDLVFDLRVHRDVDHPPTDIGRAEEAPLLLRQVAVRAAAALGDSVRFVPRVDVLGGGQFLAAIAQALGGHPLGGKLHRSGWRARGQRLLVTSRCGRGCQRARGEQYESRCHRDAASMSDECNFHAISPLSTLEAPGSGRFAPG